MGLAPCRLKPLVGDQVDRCTEWVNVSGSQPPAFLHSAAVTSPGRRPSPKDTSPAVLDTRSHLDARLHVRELLRRPPPRLCTHTDAFMQKTHPNTPVTPRANTLAVCPKSPELFSRSWKDLAFHRHHSVCLYTPADCVNPARVQMSESALCQPAGS